MILRLTQLYFSLSLEFALNALFYSDSYIQSAANKEIEGESFTFITLEDIPKSLLAFAVTWLLDTFTSKIIAIPENYEEAFNKSLITEDLEKIKEAEKQFLRKMMIRYLVWSLFVCLTTFFLWYYIIIFCAIYLSSSIGWIKESLISIGIDFGVSFLIPLSITCIREIIRKNPSLICCVCILRL